MFDSIDEYMSIHRVSVLRVILRSHHLIILACLALTAAESLFTTSSITSEGTAQLSRCHCAVCSPKSPPALSRSAASSRIHALSADPSLKPRAVQSSHARYVARGRVNRIGPPRRGPPRIGSPGRGDPPSTRVVSPPPLPSAAPPSAAPPSAAKWYQIASRLPGRTDHAIRNRFHRLQAMADDMQIINERNGINTLQEHPAAMAHRVHMPPMNVMQSIQLFPSMRAKVHDSTSPLEQQRQQLQEQQRELQRRQLVLEQQERELLQQHRQQQNMYQQQVIQGQMPRDQTSSQDQIVPQTAPLRLCV